MRRALFILLLSSFAALGGESLEQQLANRSLPFRRPPADQTLPQALAVLSADYEARYHKPLRIYIAVNIASPNSDRAAISAPKSVHGVEPLPDSDPASARTDGGPVRAPVVELLRYLTSLANVGYTVRDDIVLIHTKPK